MIWTGIIGQVKAYVGGMNYNHFMYDMVSRWSSHARTVPTIKPMYMLWPWKMV